MLEWFTEIECPPWHLFCDADGGKRKDLGTAISLWPQSGKAEGVVPFPLLLQEE